MEQNERLSLPPEEDAVFRAAEFRAQLPDITFEFLDVRGAQGEEINVGDAFLSRFR